MKNLFNNISQEEKNRILEMHSSKKNVISEQSNTIDVNVVDNMIKQVDSKWSSEFWKDPEFLQQIYKMLLPLSGKIISGKSKCYDNVERGTQRSNNKALSWFDEMWDYRDYCGNQYGMGGGLGHGFIGAIEKVGDKTFTGQTEKTSKGIPTSKIKQNIIDLINKG